MSQEDDAPDRRNEWAQDRTILANERTFAGWMRTGMACVAIALGMRAVFAETSYPYVAKGVAMVFIVTAVIIFWSAVIQCRQTKERMKDNEVESQSVSRMAMLATILTFGAIGSGIILWVL